MRVPRRTVSPELLKAIAEAQAAAQRAHNLAYAEPTSLWLRLALGKAQSILIRWEVRLRLHEPATFELK